MQRAISEGALRSDITSDDLLKTMYALCYARQAEPGWEVVAPHPFSTVCFRHVEADNDEIAHAATATGELFVASSRLRGRAMIRLAIGNARTTEDDVRLAWDVLRGEARSRAVA